MDGVRVNRAISETPLKQLAQACGNLEMAKV
jgi:hypothetical protein